jgi:hypothetical protein
MEAATIALLAEFVADLTGFRPPSEGELFPAAWRPALDRLCDGVIQAAKEYGG